MIINRRTSFTNLEFPNGFEDPEWAAWTDIPNKDLVASATAGQSVVYKVPDGAAGWYALDVIPDGLDATNKYNGSWGYTYLHEGSVVYLWCNSGNTSASGRKSLGVNGSGGALGGAAGILCGFKQKPNVGDENYGPYSVIEPQKVFSSTTSFKKWNITFADGRKTVRLTKGNGSWDGSSTTNSAIYMLIDGKPCLTFEDPVSIMGATGATVTYASMTQYDGIYLGSTPVSFATAGFCTTAGLVVGKAGASNGTGGGALGSSGSTVGPTEDFGKAPSDSSGGGIAFFDFSRGITESNQRRNADAGLTVGARLYKITEQGHDTTEPYAQKFTAPESLVGCTFTFYVNDVEYEFPEEWPDANRQEANSGEYVTYIDGVHIGDSLRVVATYDNGRILGGIYQITMHSLVYGLYLDKLEMLWKTPGDYVLVLEPGTYYTWMRGAGGAGGNSGNSGAYGNGGSGGAGGTGGYFIGSFDVSYDGDVAFIHVGAAGETYANGGNGGAGGAAGTTGGAGGAGGGAGEPSCIYINSLQYYFSEGGGGGAGGGGGGSTVILSAGSGGGGGGGGGYYSYDPATNTITSVPGKNGSANTSGGGGDNGVAGNAMFSDVKSGAGGAGILINYGNPAGGAAATGGGASGGAGGGFAGYHEAGVCAGGGGGGAGGSLDASGGQGGYSSWYSGADGSNYHTTPSKSSDYLGNVVSSGWGIGGVPGMGGTNGWLYLARGELVTEVIDAGLVATYEPTITDDAGKITGAVSSSRDAGSITGTVSTTKDAGAIIILVEATETEDLGSITDTTNEREDCGHII